MHITPNQVCAPWPFIRCRLLMHQSASTQHKACAPNTCVCRYIQYSLCLNMCLHVCIISYMSIRIYGSLSILCVYKVTSELLCTSQVWIHFEWFLCVCEWWRHKNLSQPGCPLRKERGLDTHSDMEHYCRLTYCTVSHSMHWYYSLTECMYVCRTT